MDKHMYVMSKRNNDDIATARNKTICNLIALALIYATFRSNCSKNPNTYLSMLCNWHYNDLVIYTESIGSIK